MGVDKLRLLIASEAYLYLRKSILININILNLDWNCVKIMGLKTHPRFCSAFPSLRTSTLDMDV